MGCANTKSAGGAVAVESAPEGGDAQKDVPKVMVDGEDMAINGNVVNANGIEEGTTGEELKEQTACNGDVGDKRKSKADAEADIKSDATAPSGDAKSNENGEEAKMAADPAQSDADEKKADSSENAADESRNPADD